MNIRRAWYDKRNSGIPLIGDLSWGTHICQFYDTQQDLLEILVPYFRAGLAANECCVWVGSGPSDTAELDAALKKKLHRFEEYSSKGQLEIVPFKQWRAKGGSLGNTIVSTLDKAVYGGFDGLRLGFHAEAFQKRGKRFNSDAFDAIARYNVIGLIAYSRNQFDATRLMAVVGRHRYALVRNASHWEVIESSEARIVKEALNRSEQKLQSLFDNMSEGFAYHRIVLDSAGKPCDYVFLEANEAFEKLTGLAAKDIIGKRVTEVLPGISSDTTDWIGRYGEVALTGKPVQFESYSEQLQMWYSVSAFSPHGGFFAVTFSDITERKNAEEQLWKAHDELEQKVRERTDELRRVNSMLRMISECNQALVRATEEQELMREICRIVVENGGYAMAWVGYVQDDQEKSVRPVASMGFEDGYLESAHFSWGDNETGRGPTGTCIRTGEVRICHDFLEDPKLKPWRVEAVKRGYRSSVALPLMFSGKAFGALMIYAGAPHAFDTGQAELLRELADDLAFGIMTLRARAERDQARWTAEKRAKQLQALAAELVEAEQKERRRLAQILHDHLQQLLVGAKFGVSLIRAKAQTSDIQETAEELTGTLDEAIRASRSLSADLSPPVLHEKGLAAGLEWLGRQMQQKHGLNVDIRVDAGSEPEAEEIRLFLFEAVRELLLNIVKYAQVDRAQVRMRMLESNEVEISVSDSGAGFDPAQLGISAPTTGGFGLFSIRERLNYLGGRMAIHAAPGQGSFFTLVTPTCLDRPDAETRRTGSEKSSAQGTGSAEEALAAGRKISVMIADDHPVLRHGLAKLLEEQPDIQVVAEAGDGQTAIELARQFKPDVVLMDVSLPVVNGFEATRQIVFEFPKTRVIGLSMHEEAEMAESMYNAGAVAYLTKGGPIEPLIEAIRAQVVKKALKFSQQAG